MESKENPSQHMHPAFFAVTFVQGDKRKTLSYNSLMKISGYDPLKPAVGASKRGKTSAAGGFADLLSLADAEEAAPPMHASAAAPVGNLLSLQEITEEEHRRKKLIAHGKTMLETLEILRGQLLAGVIPPHTLQQLSEDIAFQKQSVNDPVLMELLDDIELRAAVELAKLEMALKYRD